MTLAQLVDNRVEIFQRPSTKRDILQGRDVIYIDKFEDIVPRLEERQEDQAALITEDVNIIPLDKNGNPAYYSSQNFTKRGPLVRLRTFSEKVQISKEWSDLNARIDAQVRYENAPKDARFVGWCWNDPEGYTHIVQPWMVIEGRRLEAFAHKARNIADKIKVKKSYTSRDSSEIKVDVEVPSRSSVQKHKILLKHLTRMRDPARFVEWTRFSTDHQCGFKHGDFSFRFANSVTYCPHDVAAHAHYSRRVAEKSNTMPMQPFPLFTQPILRLYMSLLYDTLKVERVNKEGNLRTRPLSFAEINPILMSAWLEYGNKSTFFVRSMTKQYKTGPAIGERKRMSDYTWNVSSPGLPFDRYDK